MKNIFNLNLAAIVLIALMLPQQPALADEVDDKRAAMPAGLYNNLLPAGNVLIESVKWPNGSKKLGFKHLSIGDSFNLNSSDVNNYVRDRSLSPNHSKSFNCRFAMVAPIVECTPWETQNMKDMLSAFGDKVTFNFTVLLSRALSETEINKLDFGTGRVISITIMNKKPSQDFAAKATTFFSEKLNSQPVVRSAYKNATGLYTKQCIESISRIEKKPISELSVNDKNELSKCNNESTLAFLKGGSTSGRTTFYQWKSPDGVHVTIHSVEQKTSIGGSMPQVSSDSATIQIELDVDIVPWQNEVSRIKKEFATNKNNKAKSDF